MQPRGPRRPGGGPGRKPKRSPALSAARLNELIEQATVDAHDEEEQLMGFFAMIEDELACPFETKVLGVPVTVDGVGMTDDGPLVAHCRRGDKVQRIALLDLPLPSPPPAGSEWIEAYRHWRTVGIDISAPRKPARRKSIKSKADTASPRRGTHTRVAPKFEFHKIWVEQCEATLGIKEHFGLDKALGYLIGEKLVNFAKVANRDPKFAGELPSFVAEIKRIFQPWEIREYLENVRRIGAMGHVCTEDEHAVLRAAGALDDDPVRGAEDVLVVERIKEMLLE